MKTLRIFGVYVQEVVQFRARAFVWLVTGSVNTFILLFFWWAVLKLSGESIGGFNLTSIVTYYLLIMTFSNVLSCHNEEEMAFSHIYQGAIHRYLLQPFSYLRHVFVQEMTWRLLGGLWASIILLALHLFVSPLQLHLSWTLLLVVGISSVLSLAISYFFKSLIAMAAFWLTNIGGLLEIMAVAEILLAGLVLPVHFFPEQIRQLALASPFAAMAYSPVALLTGLSPVNEWPKVIITQAIWLAIFIGGANFAFHRGVKYYGGVSQ